MLKAIKIDLSGGINTATPGRVSDVVFVERASKLAFALSAIMMSAQLTFEEVVDDLYNGGNAGNGMYFVSGDMLLFQNVGSQGAQIANHRGLLYDVHILYMNLDVVSTGLISGINASDKGTPRKENVLFPLASLVREQFGVGLQVVDDLVSERELHVIVSGSTCDITRWKATSEKAFYDKVLPLGGPVRQYEL